jgi:hypothetical protein
MTVDTGHCLDTVQGRHPPALHVSCIQSFAALESRSSVDQGLLQRFQVETAQAVAQRGGAAAKQGREQPLT